MTPINPTEKTNFINLVRAAPSPGGPFEASRLQDILNFYEDIFTCLCRQLDLFASNNAYLAEALQIFNQAQLENVGIWFNYTQTSPPLSDPVLIVNSNITEVVITPSSPPIFQTLAIMGSSNIEAIVLADGATLNNLYIGPGSVVDMVDSSLPAATIETIYLAFLKSTPATLKMAAYQSRINQVIIEEGAKYGGVQGADPDLPCGEPVTAMSATEITNNGIFISWTPPTTGYMFIDLFYKKRNSSVWISVTDEDGDFVSNVGFEFRHLEIDTWYDFRAAVTCTNGGQVFTDITVQTVCCGAGTSLAIYKTCPVTMLISSTPDSPPLGQTLCNGIEINLHYLPGATITIPELRGMNISVLEAMIVDNVNYQRMPFDPVTVTWDASTTPLGAFIEGNVVTVNISLPA